MPTQIQPPVAPAARTLDDWMELTQEMMQRYWRDAEWVTIVVGRPGDIPNTTIPVRRMADHLPPESRPASQPVPESS